MADPKRRTLPGWFSAAGGIQTKLRLLEIERACFVGWRGCFETGHRHGMGHISCPLLYSSGMKTALNYKALPISERIELVEDIWDSIADETSAGAALSPAQRDELNRRFAAHEADPASSIPWSQVRQALFKGRA